MLLCSPKRLLSKDYRCSWSQAKASRATDSCCHVCCPVCLAIQLGTACPCLWHSGAWSLASPLHTALRQGLVTECTPKSSSSALRGLFPRILSK